VEGMYSSLRYGWMLMNVSSEIRDPSHVHKIIENPVIQYQSSRRVRDSPRSLTDVEKKHLLSDFSRGLLANRD
jgi:hypothetical protein